jgi:polyphosphate kinase
MIEPPMSTEKYINRELSWLDFNERVLTLAEDPFTPLLERAKFLAIFAANLDEFYMVRVAGLKRQQAAGLTSRSPDGSTPTEQLDRIASKVVPMVERHARLFSDEMMPGLGKDGIEMLRWGELEDDQRTELEELFTKQIFPVLTPLAVDPAHPFPYVSNLSLNLAVLVSDPSDERARFARVKVPPLLPRFVALSDEGTFVPLEDVIAANLGKLFPGKEVVEHHAFRVTRNADLEVDDDGAEDLLEALEEELRKRRFSPAVRLEVESSMPKHVLDLLMRELQIDDPDVHSLPGPLDLTSLWELYGLKKPDLKDDPFPPVTHPALVTGDDTLPNMFDVLKNQDVLIHHPYDSFTTSVQHFIEQAAADPSVLAIKQTLYRTSGESPIVDALIEAAEYGKQVVVVVELKARFDERANIKWARTLERAGCHVVYGLVGLKTHCKLALVVRQEGDRLARYVHFGTGNYNPKTARIYEDLGFLTNDSQLGADISDLFNYLTGYARQPTFRSMIVAPNGMRERIVVLIGKEADRARSGSPGRIVMKLNSLVDETIIDALYDASQAGVEIDLIVRGICALKPGVPGLSETVRVRSILGRFLEHSRILFFDNGGDPALYIGSADMMHRNLDRRVEALVRVTSVDAKARLTSMLDLALADNSSAWTLDGNSNWTRLTPTNGQPIIDLQKELMRRAARSA